MKTPCTVRKDKYRSNIELFVHTEEEEKQVARIDINLDGLDDEDKVEAEKLAKSLENCDTVEEVETILANNDMDELQWN